MYENNFISRLINLGTERKDLSDQRIIRLVNGVSLLTVLITIFIGVSILFSSGFQLINILTTFIAALGYSLIPLLNHLGKHKVAKWLLIIYTNFGVVGQYYSTSGDVGSWVVFIGLFTLYVALLNKRWEIYLISCLSVILVVSCIWLQALPSFKPLANFTKEEETYIQIGYFIGTAGLVLLLTLFVRGNLVDHQKRLEIALNEKEVLLKEVHHRVKNNLQIISSLFNIQERRLDTKNETAKKVIKSGQSRIQSMALVHQQLYDNSNLKGVRINEYIKNLVKHIAHLYVKHEMVKFNLSLDDSTLELEQVIPIGLILNEAVTNSFKHAFIDQKHAPEINIHFSKTENLYTLRLWDNGNCTIPKKEPSNGIGIQLIEDMASQLNGTYDLQTSPFFSHTITFAQ